MATPVLPGELTTWPVPSALAALRPEASACLERVSARVQSDFDPIVLELTRLRIAQLIGHSAGLGMRSTPARLAGLTEDKIADLPAYPNSPRFSAFEACALEFAEQLVIDASGTSPDIRAALAAEVGVDELRNFVTAVFVVEFTQRLEMIVSALLPGGALSTPTPTADRSMTLRSLLDDFQAAVVRASDVDPTTTELVRLRCARTHHCRICQTLRLDDARAAGVDDTMTSKIDFYEQSDLPERAKIALRITDAFIVAPNELAGPTIERAHAVFTAEQLAELCLDIMKWSTQKIHVALEIDGADGLPTKDGVALFGFDSDGTVAGYWTS